MQVIICPGIHDPQLTQEFLEGLAWQEASYFVFPAQQYPAYSALDILQFLYAHQSLSLELPLVFLGFSAGAVGAIGAAWGWQLRGGTVKAFIALDAWGMPLGGNFPIHRLSHDYFTHWSSALLGEGEDSFYADPPVEHLNLWRSPQSTLGWWVRQTPNNQDRERIPANAASFIRSLLQLYNCNK